MKLNLRGPRRTNRDLLAAYREIQRLEAELEVRIAPEEYPELAEQIAYWQTAAFQANERAEIYQFAMQQIMGVTKEMLEGLLKDIDGI